jgi:hypothetical protein
MGCTDFTEPQCLYKGDLYLYLYLYLDVLDGANNIFFLISNVKFVFCNSKDHHFPGFEERVVESIRLDTVQMKVTPP